MARIRSGRYPLAPFYTPDVDYRELFDREKDPLKDDPKAFGRATQF